MRRQLLGALSLTAVLYAADARAQAQPDSAKAPVVRMIDMGGYRLRVRSSEPVVDARPTVVFESGLGTRLETWTDVQRDVAAMTGTFSYDRAGIGLSDPGRAAPTVPHILEELRALLAKSGVRPPYVLVGHSLGGAVIRLFAARYPGEVAGLVFVDPADFMQSVADQDEIFKQIGVSGARAQFNDNMLAMYRKAGMPAGVRAEAEAFSPEYASGFPTFRALPPLPDVPSAVLLAGKYEAPRDGFTPVPGGLAKDSAFTEAWVRQRLTHMTTMIGAGTPGAQGMLLLTPASGHYIQNSEPALVTMGIERVLFPDVGTQLERAASKGGADGVLSRYAALRRSHPATSFTESTLNRVGYAFLDAGKTQDALKIMQRNVAEYPNASNPHDSLGEAYMAIGNRELAIVHYERSLALDPQNRNAAERLKKLRTP